MTSRRRPAIAALLLLVTSLAAACTAPASGSPPPAPTAAVEPPATGGPPVSASPVAEQPTAAPTPTVAASEPLSPSPVAAADLLVRLDVCGDTCVDPRRVEYLADGRVITLDLTTGDFVMRRLSPAGLGLVRSRLIADADLLGRDLSVDIVPVPGKTPPGHGLTSFTFISPGAAGGRVTARTATSDSLDPGYWVPDPRRDRLTALGGALLDPEKLAGPDGWTDPVWTAYEPSKTAVFVHVRDGAAPFSSPDLAATGWPLGDDPRTFGEPFASTMDAWPIARCAVLDTAAAREATATLPADALSPSDPGALLRMGTMAWPAKGLELEVVLRALLPDDEGAPCGDFWIGG